MYTYDIDDLCKTKADANSERVRRVANGTYQLVVATEFELVVIQPLSIRLRPQHTTVALTQWRHQQHRHDDQRPWRQMMADHHGWSLETGARWENVPDVRQTSNRSAIIVRKTCREHARWLMYICRNETILLLRPGLAWSVRCMCASNTGSQATSHYDDVAAQSSSSSNSSSSSSTLADAGCMRQH